MAFLNRIKFANLTQHLEALSNAVEIDEQEEILRCFFDSLKNFQENNNENMASSVFPLIRLLLADEDTGSGKEFGLNEKKLKDLFLSAVGMSSQEAQQIESALETGFEEAIYEIAESKLVEESTLFVSEIDAFLNLISENPEKDQLEAEFKRIIRSMSALDVKWIFKIILKRGADLLSTGEALQRVCELMESVGAEDFELRLMVPYPPMMPKTFIAQVDDELFQKNLYIETKFDGERFQLHIDNSQDQEPVIRWFSAESGDCLTSLHQNFYSFLKFNQPVKTLILDGVMTVYDVENKKFMPKYDSINVKTLHLRTDLPSLILVFVAFDVLFLNGTNFINTAFEHRIEVLKNLFEDDPSKVIKTHPVFIQNNFEIPCLIHEAFENGKEEIILKEADSKYLPGEKCGGWWKLKTDYMQGVVMDVSVIIIGGFLKNEGNSLKNQFVVGCVDQAEDGSWDVHAIGMVANGLTEDQKVEIQKSLKSIMIEKKFEDETVEFDEGRVHFSERQCDVWFPPNKSVVLNLQALELNRVTEDYTDYEFKFLRISVVNEDSQLNRCVTLEEINELCPMQTEKV